MRSGLDGTTAALYDSGVYDVHWRLRVQNGSGTFKSLQGRYDSLDLKLPDPVEPIGSLSFSVIRDSTISGTAGSLSPYVEASTFNKLDDTVTYSPLLQLGRLVTLDIILTTVGAARPADGDSRWYEIFRAIITKVGSGDFDSHNIRVDCNGFAAILQHAKSEDAYTYAQGTSLETVVSQVLSNNGFGSVVTYFPVATGAVLPNTYAPGLQKTVWSQLRAIAQSLGWVVYYRYRGTGVAELTFFEPARTKVVPDMTVVADDFKNLDLDEEELRNVGYLIYVDADGEEQILGPEEDAASILKYGNIRRPFWIKLDAFSPIRDGTAGQSMLEAALSDVADPDVVATASTVPLVFAESGVDLYAIPSKPRFFDNAQSWAVFSNVLSVAVDAAPRSFLGLRGVPTAGMKSWRDLATRLPTDGKIKTYFQADAPTNPNIADEWIDSDDDNERYRWDGAIWIIVEVQSIEAVVGTVGGWSISPTELSAGGVKIQAVAERVLLGAATAPLTGIGIFIGKDGADYEFRAGNPAGQYIHWTGSALNIVGTITATSGTIGGWSITTGEIFSGNFKLQSANERILVGSATAPLTGAGVFIGYDGGGSVNYDFRVGDPATTYLHWDGSAGLLTVRGAVIESPGTGTSIGILGWTHDMVFSATDADTVAWASGTIRLQNGVTYSITGANTGNMTTDATRYVYLDTAASTTALQVSLTNADAVGANRILVAVCRRALNGTAADHARFIVYGGSGGVGVFVTADEIAANTITGNKMVVNTLNASYISSLSFSGKTATFDLGSVGGWTMSGGTLSSGSVTISAAAQRILVGSATAPLTGNGIFIGLDGSDYEFRAGNPAGDYIHFDGTTFTIKTNTFTGTNPVFTGAVTVRGGDATTRLSIDADTSGGRILFYEGATPTLIGQMYARTNDLYLVTVNNKSLQIDVAGAGNCVINYDTGEFLVIANGVGRFQILDGASTLLQSSLDEQLRINHTSSTGSPYLQFYQNGTARAYIQHAYQGGGQHLYIVERVGDVVIAAGNVNRIDVQPASGIVSIESGTADEQFRINHASSTGSPYISWFQSGTLRSYIQHVNSGHNFAVVSAHGTISLWPGTGGTPSQVLSASTTGVAIGVPTQIGTSLGDGTPVQAIYSATTTWNPGSIAAGAAVSTTVTVTGAAVGDAVFVVNEHGAQDNSNLMCFARVTATNTVTIYLHNTITGGASIDPASRTVRVVVMKF